MMVLTRSGDPHAVNLGVRRAVAQYEDDPATDVDCVAAEHRPYLRLERRERVNRELKRYRLL